MYMFHYPVWYTVYMYIIPSIVIIMRFVIIGLVRRYSKIIQNYYLKFMGGFDAAQMREIVMV